mgnify:CR=1 FL=1
MLIKFLTPDFVFEDDRGGLVQLVHSGYKQVNVIHSKAGAIRGNHYHKCNKEAFYVIKGTFLLKLSTLQGDISESYSMKEGTFFEIPENITHSFEFMEDTLLVSMYQNGVVNSDGTKDIYS